MAGIFGVIAILIICGVGFLTFYKLYWEKQIDRKDVEEKLAKKGIGDKPETIVRQYYKIIHNEILEEKEVKRRTNQFIANDQEFFLTMWENMKKKNGETIG